MLITHTRIAAALLLAAASSLAAAQGKFYVAGSIGAAQSSGDYAGQVRSAGSPTEGFAFVSAAREGGSEAGGRLALGYRVNDVVSVELGYANFGRHDLNYRFEKKTGLIPPDPFFRAVGQFKLDGATLDVIGIVPINQGFSVNARLGIMATNLKYVEYQTFATLGTTFFSRTERESALHFGVGGTYQLNRALGITLDYTRAQNVGKRFKWTEENNGRLSYGLLAAGIRYSF
jgi:OmpA-like transmembrane domain